MEVLVRFYEKVGRVNRNIFRTIGQNARHSIREKARISMENFIGVSDMAYENGLANLRVNSQVIKVKDS